MRVTRKDKVKWLKSQDGKLHIKIRLRPLLRVGAGCVWLASLGAHKSRRMINDWMNERSGKSSGKVLGTLRGKEGIRLQLEAMRMIRQWYQEIPEGDSISFRCQSKYPDKQFRAWKKWFENREDPRWQIIEQYNGFFLYKPITVDDSWYKDYGRSDYSDPSDPCGSQRYYGFDTYP